MKYKFEQLINRSYKAIKERGLITDKTETIDFLTKIDEEIGEAYTAEYNIHFDINSEENKQKYIEELTDIATVAIMQIHHLGHNFIDEFEKVVIKNETRKD